MRMARATALVGPDLLGPTIIRVLAEEYLDELKSVQQRYGDAAMFIQLIPSAARP